MENEGKKKDVEIKTKSSMWVVILIAVLVIALGCEFVYIRQLKSEKQNTNIKLQENETTELTNNRKNNEIISENSKDNVNSIITFDKTKAVNSNEKNYTLACQGNAGIFITVDSSQKELTFSYTPKEVTEFYSLNWKSSKTEMSSDTIKFDKKIVGVFFGGMGQSNSGDTLFILLEDKTLEYIPIVHMLNNVQGAPVSYGKINGVSDVTKLTLASINGEVTTLAIKSDGTFYDMWQVLKDTGNY